jgi:hypothetical protein
MCGYGGPCWGTVRYEVFDATTALGQRTIYYSCADDSHLGRAIWKYMREQRVWGVSVHELKWEE